ncbi:NADPH-dependent diflavin oxidoreductase 1 [Paramicrosporidium saccamoebae]|uniref:NADPH-dependent diflavin oxidoreductase 1 n=1 Tax=Paramicrosporidium saccamoebae TaxID=1246581 RepID=A0A2H9TLW4_9FUNG|nr:NADPH-dependent diflavin oxidoreductase 1 [Paramicrosporidium saccamoebae]
MDLRALSWNGVGVPGVPGVPDNPAIPGSADIPDIPDSLEPIVTMQLQVLYASQSGTAQEYAERFATEAYRRKIQYSVLSVDEYGGNIEKEEMVVFFVSTTGDGEAPTTMHSFWHDLLRKSHPNLDNMHCAVFGLGDSSYEKFNYVGKRLYRRLEQLGAQFITERADADEQHPLGIDGAYVPWSATLWEYFYNTLAWPLDPILEYTPKVRLSPATKEGQLFPLKYNSVLTENRRITTESHFQNVRHLVFKCDDYSPMVPGDVAVLKPVNSDKLVDELLEILKWEDKVYHVTALRSEVRIPTTNPISIRSLFKYHLDIVAPPKRIFFQILSQMTVDELHGEKLAELSSAEGIDLYLDYVYRPKRTPAEVLRDFAATVSIEYIFDLFPVLRPREYSISSSSRMHPDEVHITAAMVEYRTNLTTPRLGVCSRWLAPLPIGSSVSIDVRKGNWTLPPCETPLILIAGGTGIAPMRAIIQHCPTNPKFLFFGCRYLEHDFHYRDEWPRYPALTIAALGSRDLPGARKHLDELLRRNGEMLKKLLQEGAYVYVAGNSKLPALIKKTIVEITNDPNLPAKLTRDNRLQIEAWS